MRRTCTLAVACGTLPLVQLIDEHGHRLPQAGHEIVAGSREVWTANHPEHVHAGAVGPYAPKSDHPTKLHLVHWFPGQWCKMSSASDVTLARLPRVPPEVP